MTDLEKKVLFLGEIEKLKQIKRDNLTLDDSRPENPAEHSWHVSLMAMILFDERNESYLDQLKVLKMLLVHDLVEVYAGDTSIFSQVDKAKTHQKEEDSLLKLAKLLPMNLEDEIISLWNEFESMETEEAKFARSLDALQPLMNHYFVAPTDYNPNSLTKEEVYAKKEFIKDCTPRLWPLVEEIIEKSAKKGLYK